MSDVLVTEAPVRLLSPIGRPPTISRKGLAPRLDGLDGRTVFLVDCRFDDSVELLRQIERWFTENMPSVTVELVQLASTYGRDDPELWKRIQLVGGAAILGVGHCSTCAPAVATHGVTLESAYGVPVVTLHTATFQRVVRSVIQMAGLADLACVYVPQPVMGKSEAELWAYVEGDDPTTGRPVMNEIIDALTTTSPGGTAVDSPRITAVSPGEFASDDDAHRFFLTNHLTDSLPIVLPTVSRVEEMLAHTGHPRDEVVGRMQPTQNRGAWEYTVEKVAVNAVMSGASPEYFPVILALAASQISARSSSSSSAAVMAVVNGPIRQEIGMNAGIGALGPFNHANATIGRAYGLLSQNLQGGSVPGESYMGSLGNGYGYNNLTFAENEERSPWEPLHVQHGFAPDASTVTIFSGCRSTTFNLGLREKYWREHVRDMLVGLDSSLTPPTLLLDPIVARQFIDRGGFTNKADLIAFVCDTLRMPAGQYWDLQLIQNYVYPRATNGEEPFATRLKAGSDELITIHEPKDINVITVGGETNGYWQVMGCHLAKTVSIDAWR